MADVVRRVDYYYALVPNRAGAGSKVLQTLKAAGVNLLAYSGFPATPRQSQLDLVPVDSAALLKAANKAGILLVGPKQAFLLQGQDRMGAVADVLQKLASAKINVTAMTGIAADRGRYGALLWVHPRNIKRAAALLGSR